MSEPAPTLRGERVMLRLTTPADADRLLEILREPEVHAWWGHYDAERVRTELVDAEDEVVFAIEAGEALIGAIQYYEETEPDYRYAAIDIFLATARQGEGLGTEAVRVLARHLVDERGHHRLTIDPAVANARAIRAYEKVGVRPVGVMRQYERGPDGTWHDSLLMDLLAPELQTVDSPAR